MYKSFFLSFIATISTVYGFGQQKSYSLEEIVNLAIEHNPVTRQKSILTELGKENERLLSAALFPEMKISEQNTFQTEVTSIDIPGFTSPKKDNYNIGFDIRYPLTDFGSIRTQRDIEKANTNLGQSKLDIDLQKLKERIVMLYGNIILQKENKDILQLRASDLESRQKIVASGVEQGAVLKSNQLIFESEILSTEQKIEDTDASINSLVQELSILSGAELHAADTFILPTGIVLDKAIFRPETEIFKTQKDILSLKSSLLKKENAPKVFLFGQGLYGRPGYNFLDTSFRPYGTVGLGISFNINKSINQSKNLKLNDLNKQVLDQQEALFNMNLHASLDPRITDIQKYERIISKDEQILSKRKEIIRAANSQLENGVITSSDYLTELNAENVAQLNLTLHKVQRALAIVQYNTILGY